MFPDQKCSPSVSRAQVVERRARLPVRAPSRRNRLDPLTAACIDVLWCKPNAELSTLLLPLLTRARTPAAIKLSAAVTIGYAGNPANDPKLISLLDDPSARPYAMLAVVLGGSEAGARKLLELLPIDHHTEAVLRRAIANTENDHFDLLREPMFSSGQIYRRMRVAELLKDGDPASKVSYGYVWAQLMTRLATGWSGPSGMSVCAVRAELYRVLMGDDADKRRMVAAALADMHARGVLLAARDAGVEEARVALLGLVPPGRHHCDTPRSEH